MCDDAGVARIPSTLILIEFDEEAFAEMKAWMKKNYRLHESFEGFLEAALRHMQSKPGNHFRLVIFYWNEIDVINKLLMDYLLNFIKHVLSPLL